MTQSSPESETGMLCPACRVQLTMSERQGVEIDYCPQCRGVWLDRGELDKIIERSETKPSEAERAGSRDDYPRDRHGREHRGRGHDGRRKGFLAELFD
ncbi:zf-TFIIB domain-containing protein [Sphingorhabdus buctiana]|jgi:uncharacterized protein|uniref:Zf-TFIIB domain-containing protein n=1 Tax=Sphingorhabdus buctiana TaxID=1508805 RepID=A0ABW4MFW3_9SPHN